MRTLLAPLFLVACGGMPEQDPATRVSPSPSPSPTSAPKPSPPLSSVAAIAEPEPADACPAGDWCWARNRPLTVGGDRARGTAYAIGPEGVFLRWDDDRWVSMPVPTRRTLTSAVVLGPEGAWASDETGSAWVLQRESGLAGVWQERPASAPIARLIGGPDGQLYAVAGGSASAHGSSSGATLLRREGDRWAQAIAPHEYCLGGDYLVRPDGEVWSTGLFCDESGAVRGLEVRRFDAGGWTLVGEPIMGQGWFPSFEALGERVRVRGTGTFEWDGRAWIVVERPLPPQRLPLDQTFFWDGFGYSVVPRATGCTDGFRLDLARAWCWGSAGISAETTAGWAPTLIDTYRETLPDDAWGTVPPELWAGGDTRVAWGTGPEWIYRVQDSTGGKLERRVGGVWQTELDLRVIDVDGVAEGQTVWAVTEDKVMRLRGGRCAQWIEEPLPQVFGEIGRLLEVRVFDPRSVFVLGTELLLRFDGTGWSAVERAPRGWHHVSIAGTSPEDLWLLRHEDGRSNEVRVARSDGLGFTDVIVPGASGFGRLETIGGETWLATDGQVARLGATIEAMPLPARLFESKVWANGSEIWLSSAAQSLRRAR